MTRDLSCIGCGYCCSVAICVPGQRAYNILKGTCPGLVWDEDANRHWCKLAKMQGQRGIDYREELAIGTACSSTMFNDWRENIQDRTGATEKKFKIVEMDRYFKLFIHSLSKQFMSGELKYMIVMMWARDMVKIGVDEDTVKAMVKEINHIITEGSPSYLKGFMP